MKRSKLDQFFTIIIQHDVAPQLFQLTICIFKEGILSSFLLRAQTHRLYILICTSGHYQARSIDYWNLKLLTKTYFSNTYVLTFKCE